MYVIEKYFYLYIIVLLIKTKTPLMTFNNFGKVSL